MDAFYEEDERIVGHAADAYHRIDIRQSLASSGRQGRREAHRRHQGAGRAVRVWFRAALVRAAPRHRRECADPGRGTNVLPLQGASQLLRHRRSQTCGLVLPAGVARSCTHLQLCLLRAGPVEVFLDDKRLALEAGQSVMPHGIDRGLDPTRYSSGARAPSATSARCFAKLATALRCRSRCQPAAGNSRSGHFLPLVGRVDQAHRQRTRRSIRSRSCDRRRCGTTT